MSTVQNISVTNYTPTFLKQKIETCLKKNSTDKCSLENAVYSLKKCPLKQILQIFDEFEEEWKNNSEISNRKIEELKRMVFSRK